MIKGKTISTVDLNSISEDISKYGIRNSTIVSDAPTMLKSTKTINSDGCSGVEPVMSSLKPKIIKQTPELYYEKIIENSSNKIEIIQQNKNIRYSVDLLKSKFPGYSNLYYIELFDLLETTDYNLTPDNLNTNLLKFMLLGNNIQSQISRLNENLGCLRENSFEKIKENTSENMGILGFFIRDEKIKELYKDFNEKIKDFHSLIYKEYTKIKNINLDKYRLIDLYKDFFIFIYEELKGKNVVPESELENSLIVSRIVSLDNSKTVYNQFLLLLELETKTIETELENTKNYLDILKPSLDLLQKQDFKEFKEQFKKLIKD